MVDHKYIMRYGSSIYYLQSSKKKKKKGFWHLGEASLVLHIYIHCERAHGLVELSNKGIYSTHSC